MCLFIRRGVSRNTENIRDTKEENEDLPVQINVEDIEKFVAPFLEPVPSDRIEEVRNDNVRSDDGVHCPESVRQVELL